MLKRLIQFALVLCASVAAAQTAQPLLQPQQHFVNAAGSPCAGCQLFSYAAGTTNPLATYTDSTEGSQNTNPIILDPSGAGSIWLGASSYKFILEDANGTVLWTVDNVASIGLLISGGLANYVPIAGGTMTGPLVTKTIDGALNASSWQSSTGSNNGISLSIADCLTYSYACQVLAPALYAQTEAQPWGGFEGTVTTNVTGPKSSDPLGCVVDQRWASPQVVCNQGLPLDSSGRFLMAPWGIVQNALSMGQSLSPHNINALIQATQWMGGRDFPTNLSTDESTLNGLTVNTNIFTPTNNDNVQIASRSWSPADNVAVGISASGVGTTLGQNEGTEVRYRMGETGNISQVTLSGAPTCGVTCTMAGTQTAGTTGAFGEELPWIDLNQGYSTSYVASISSDTVTGNASTNWDSVYGTSNCVTTTTAAIKNPGSTNSFPQTNVTISVASSTGCTAAAAYAFDNAGDAKWQGFHITSIPDGTHIIVDRVYYPIQSGATIAQGGLTGYGFDMDADNVCGGAGNGISTGGADSAIQSGLCVKNLFPIVSNTTGDILTAYGGPFLTLLANGRAYQSMGGSGGSATVTISGGAAVSCTATGGTGYISAQDPPQLTISGITYTTAPVIYVSGTSGGALSACTVATAGSGISGSAAVAVTTSNPYHIYPLAESVQNYNATTGKMDASALVTMPWTGTVSSGDVVEQQHYFNYKATGFVMNAVASAWQHYGQKFGGNLTLSGVWGGNDYAFQVTNNADPSVYSGSPLQQPYVIGRGQMTTPWGYFLNGQYRNGILLTVPPSGGSNRTGAVVVACGVYCALWTSSYNVLTVQNSNDSNFAEDVLQYNPSTQAWYWTTGAVLANGGSPSHHISFDPTNSLEVDGKAPCYSDGTNCPTTAYTVSWTPSAATVSACVEQTVTVTGVVTTRQVGASPPGFVGTHVWIGSVRPSSANTVSVAFCADATGGTPPSGNWLFRQ
jgi:hypothetical protein